MHVRIKKMRCLSMDNIWEFFEDLDEMVYVSDVQTYELVFMNRHLRNALGYTSHSDYVGQPCYAVLQGRSSPCDFCTNQNLEVGKFLSWTHKNPVLGKRFLVKDGSFFHNGRQYRMEIAIDVDADVVCRTPYYYARSETILNECLQQIFSSATPEGSIHNMLSYLGTTFSCDRAYIFEQQDEFVVKNTYEWCAENVSPQKAVLQSVPLSAIDWWMPPFERNEVIVIDQLEEIRAKHPEAYAILKPQDITSLAAGPIKVDGQVIGFLGVDNPNEQMMSLVTPLLNVIGYFTTSLLKRRDLLRRLHELSYYDQMTGALNRNALVERYGTLNAQSIGVLNCDITGLKRINDAQGHEAGDRLICRCYNLIRDTLRDCMIFRSGGDEFTVVYSNCPEDVFHDHVSALQNQLRNHQLSLSVGYVWSDQQPLMLEKLVSQAGQAMYQNKRAYYDKNHALPGAKHRDQLSDLPTPAFRSDGPFQDFLNIAYCDTEALFQSIAQDNASSYFYFGDMQRDIFYISDNMRDDFGFQDNVVPGLLKLWAKRISTPEFQDLFWQDISGMLREKRTLHDLSYRVRDIHGNNQWIRCYGMLKWDQEKTTPLFFSGRVTHQDVSFVIDPISNLPREHTAYRHLADQNTNGEKSLVIGFSLNGITEVNSTKGRSYGDRLLKKVADSLMENLSWKMYFYRLEGMRCMAIVHPIVFQSETKESLVEQLRSIIRDCYESMGISIQNTCSFGLMEYPCHDFTPEDLVDNLISLIRVARQEVKDQYVEYSAQSIQQIKQMSNMALALCQDVTHGMQHFRIVIQPVVAAGDGTAIGGEVLLRWTFEGRDVSPGIFIPILEKENMIHLAGRWVFGQAACTCARLHAYDPAFYLTFNVSLLQLSDSGFLPFMRDVLEKYQLAGSSLVAELTESCLDEQPKKLEEFVAECQKMGLYIALDDFGSGYSSLRMLLQYPSSIIKLDKSLVQEVTESDEKMNFIRSIVYACHQFGKAVCMEGVEDAGQNSIILDTGCDMIQGYYYYRPMEVHDVYQLVSENQQRIE